MPRSSEAFFQPNRSAEFLHGLNRGPFFVHSLLVYLTSQLWKTETIRIFSTQVFGGQRTETSPFMRLSLLRGLTPRAIANKDGMFLLQTLNKQVSSAVVSSGAPTQ